MKYWLEDGAFAPERAHATDAGLDLRCRDTQYVYPGDSIVFDTGVHIELPQSCWAKVESKSGLNVNFGIVSCGGVIDEGYTGSICVKLYNLGKEGYLFRRGDKIAQLVILPYLAPELEYSTDFKETERGDRGFGSTGK